MNYHQKRLFSEKSKRLRRRKDRVLPTSIIIKLLNNTMKYYHGRWEKNKKVHVVCDSVATGDYYTFCGIVKKIAPILQDRESEIQCTVCGKIYKEICGGEW